MTQRKTDKMMIRMTPEAQDALRRLAEKDCRSMAGELEWLIRSEAERRGAGATSREDVAKQPAAFRAQQAEASAGTSRKLIEETRRERTHRLAGEDTESTDP